MGRSLAEFVFMIHMREVEHLLDIAARQQRRADSEIVLRASVVFLVAVWQTYVEAVADYLVGVDRVRKTTRLSTPTGKNVDDLFAARYGIQGVSDGWKWRGMTVAAARTKLKKLVDLRHQIAHKARLRVSLRRTEVLDYVHFIHRLAVCLENTTHPYKAALTKSKRLRPLRYGGVLGHFRAP